MRKSLSWIFIGIGVVTAIIIADVMLLEKQKQLHPFLPSLDRDVHENRADAPQPIARSVNGRVELQRHGDNGRVRVIVNDMDNQFILQWNDWLLYTVQRVGSDGMVQESERVEGYFLPTGETRVLFQLENYTRDQLVGADTSITDLKRVEDTLYVMVGGYLQTGGVFWIPFPFDSGEPQLVMTDENPDIEFLDGSYWIVGGEGDGCFGFRYYRRFDPTTNTVGPRIEFIDDCGTGSSFLGVYGQETLIGSTFHTELLSGNPDPEMIVYDEVYAVHASTGQKTTLLRFEDRSALVTEIVFDAARRQLIFFGRAPAVYSLESKRSTPVVPVVNLEGYFSLGIIDKKICMSNETSASATTISPTYAQFDLVTNAVTLLPGTCFVNPEGRGEEVVWGDQVRAFTLPREFVVVGE